MTRPSALLLDLDGTLVDSEPMHRAVYRRFFESRGWEADERTIHMFAGRRADDVFAVEEGPWRGHDPQILFEEVLSHYPYVRHILPTPVPGAVDLLSSARQWGVPLALVTSATMDWARVALDHIGGADAFDVLVTRDDVEEGKPHPAPFLLACERLGARAEDALACEDAPAGIMAAVRANVGRVVGITTTASAEALLAAGAHAAHPDLRGVLTDLESTVAQPSP